MNAGGSPCRRYFSYLQPICSYDLNRSAMEHPRGAQLHDVLDMGQSPRTRIGTDMKLHMDNNEQRSTAIQWCVLALP